MNSALCHVFFEEYPKDSRIRRYVNTLRERGFALAAVCIGQNEGFYRFENGIHVYRLPLRKKRRGFASRLLEYALFFAFATVMTTYVSVHHRMRFFHVHTLPDFLVFSCTLPWVFGAKVILDFHELFPEFMMQQRPRLGFDSVAIRALRLQEKLSYRFADAVIAFHDPALEILKLRNGEKRICTVVMNAVDDSEMPVLGRRKHQKYRIVYNGTINTNLNLPLVVEALHVLEAKDSAVFNSVEFALYGDGPDLENVLARARLHGLAEKVKYRGRLPFTEMMKALENASVCVLPPKKDIYSDLYYSLKLVEMIHLKIPVIASRLNTYLHYYPEDSLIYFEPGNTVELADKLCFVYHKRGKVQSFTHNAYAHSRFLSWDIMSKRYLDLLAQMQTAS